MLKVVGVAVVLGTIGVCSEARTQQTSPVAMRTGQIATSQTQTPKAVRSKSRKTVASTGIPAAPGTVWTGADPSKGPGIERLRQLQREGRCVMDEGYGRFTYCSNQ